MAASSRRPYHHHHRNSAAPLLSPSTAFASSTAAVAAAASNSFLDHHRRSVSPSPSVRFAIDRSRSPRRSIAAAPPPQARSHHVVRIQSSSSLPKHQQQRTCLCSPTTHPGSFRCALHKAGAAAPAAMMPYSPNRLNMRRSAMTNSLVRIGTVEGDLMKRALASLIRPSSHQQRRRADFRPRPSRLSVVSSAAAA